MTAWPRQKVIRLAWRTPRLRLKPPHRLRLRQRPTGTGRRMAVLAPAWPRQTRPRMRLAWLMPTLPLTAWQTRRRMPPWKVLPRPKPARRSMGLRCRRRTRPE